MIIFALVSDFGCCRPTFAYPFPTPPTAGREAVQQGKRDAQRKAQRFPARRVLVGGHGDACALGLFQARRPHHYGNQGQGQPRPKGP